MLRVMDCASACSRVWCWRLMPRPWSIAMVKARAVAMATVVRGRGWGRRHLQAASRHQAALGCGSADQAREPRAVMATVAAAARAGAVGWVAAVREGEGEHWGVGTPEAVAGEVEGAVAMQPPHRRASANRARPAPRRR